MVKEKISAEKMFKEVSKDYHARCVKLFRSNLWSIAGVVIRYIFFGIALWLLIYSRNTAVSLTRYMVFYNTLFILLAVFSYLLGLFGQKTEKKGSFSRIVTGFVDRFFAMPARGAVEAFLNLGNHLFFVTREQFIFGMRLIHSLNKEIPRDFIQEVYSAVISPDELDKVLSFLKFMDLITVLKKDDRVLIFPTKTLQLLQQRFAEPGNEFPPLNEMDRLNGILTYIRDFKRECVTLETK